MCISGISAKNRLAFVEYKRRTFMSKLQNLSTGPTSEEGKAISCQNSTKHGLTSVKLNTSEEQSLYDEMVTSLNEELNPQGMTEENLVSDMAMIRSALIVLTGLRTHSSLSSKIKKQHQKNCCMRWV